MTLYLDRPPEGEWIAMRSGCVTDFDGIGLAEVVQLDRRGRYGRSLQALVENPVPPSYAHAARGRWSAMPCFSARR